MNTKTKVVLGVLALAVLIGGGVLLSDNGGYKGAMMPLANPTKFSLSTPPRPMPLPAPTFTYQFSPARDSISITISQNGRARSLTEDEGLMINEGVTVLASSNSEVVRNSNGQIKPFLLTGGLPSYKLSMNFSPNRMYDIYLFDRPDHIAQTQLIRRLPAPTVSYNLSANRVRYCISNGDRVCRPLFQGETLGLYSGVTPVATSLLVVEEGSSLANAVRLMPTVNGGGETYYVANVRPVLGTRYDSYLFDAPDHSAWNDTRVYQEPVPPMGAMNATGTPPLPR